MIELIYTYCQFFLNPELCLIVIQRRYIGTSDPICQIPCWTNISLLNTCSKNALAVEQSSANLYVFNSENEFATENVFATNESVKQKKEKNAGGNSATTKTITSTLHYYDTCSTISPHITVVAGRKNFKYVKASYKSRFEGEGWNIS